MSEGAEGWKLEIVTKTRMRAAVRTGKKGLGGKDMVKDGSRWIIGRDTEAHGLFLRVRKSKGV